MRCGLVQPYFRGTIWIKFDGETEPFQRYLIAYQQCSAVATVEETDGYLTLHHCEQHVGAVNPDTFRVVTRA